MGLLLYAGGFAALAEAKAWPVQGAAKRGSMIGGQKILSSGSEMDASLKGALFLPPRRFRAGAN